MYYSAPIRHTTQGINDVLERIDRWLYGSWDKEKLDRYEFLSSFGLIGDYFDYRLSVRADEEYLNRYGMSYNDIHDPRTLSQASSGTRLYGSAIQFVSKNIGRLYR